MNTRKAIITLGLVLGSFVMLPVAHADEWDQASKLTFSQSVQIPGRVLPGGDLLVRAGRRCWQP